MAEAAPTRTAEEWRATARSFAQNEIRPLASRIDRDDQLPVELLRALSMGGYLGLGVPPEWGGQGGTLPMVVGVLEELAHESAAVAVVVAVHLSVCAKPILEWGSDDQKRRYLPALTNGERIGAFALTEPGAGSDAAGLRTRYERSEGGFVLSGSKMFISNAATAGVVLVFATRDPNLGHQGISAFVIPPGTEGLTVSRHFEKLGLRGSETTELVLQDVRVGPEALLGREGDGLRIALQALTGGRVGIASCALGVARAAFTELRRNVRSDDAEWKRHLLARSYSDLAAAAALVDLAARPRNEGAPTVVEASVAKLVASRAAVSIASAGVDVAGPGGIRSGAVAERLLRDARVFPLVEGTTEIQELILARTFIAADGETPLERTL